MTALLGCLVGMLLGWTLGLSWYLVWGFRARKTRPHRLWEDK